MIKKIIEELKRQNKMLDEMIDKQILIKKDLEKIKEISKQKIVK